MIDQLNDQLVFKVKPVTTTSDGDIRVLHRNMLLPIKTNKEHPFTGQEHVQNMALMKANLLMDIHFIE